MPQRKTSKIEAATMSDGAVSGRKGAAGVVEGNTTVKELLGMLQDQSQDKGGADGS